MEKIIHIKAESDLISVNELCPEKNAVKRLSKIRDSFMYLSSKFRSSYPDAKLIVKTCVHNPEFQFK